MVGYSVYIRALLTSEKLHLFVSAEDLASELKRKTKIMLQDFIIS